MIHFKLLLVFILAIVVLNGCSSQVTLPLKKIERQETVFQSNQDYFLQINTDEFHDIVAIHPFKDNRIFVVMQKSIFLYDVLKKKIVREYLGFLGKGENGTICNVAVNKTSNILTVYGNFFDSNGNDTILRNYNIDTGRLIKTVLVDDKEIIKIVYTKDEHHLITLSRNNLKIWSIKDNNFRLIRSVKLLNEKIDNIETFYDPAIKKDKIILTSADGNTYLYNLKGEILKEVKGYYKSKNILIKKDLLIIGGGEENPYVSTFDYNLSKQKIYTILDTREETVKSYIKMISSQQIEENKLQLCEISDKFLNHPKVYQYMILAHTPIIYASFIYLDNKNKVYAFEKNVFNIAKKNNVSTIDLDNARFKIADLESLQSSYKEIILNFQGDEIIENKIETSKSIVAFIIFNNRSIYSTSESLYINRKIKQKAKVSSLSIDNLNNITIKYPNNEYVSFSIEKMKIAKSAKIRKLNNSSSYHLENGYIQYYDPLNATMRELKKYDYNLRNNEKYQSRILMSMLEIRNFLSEYHLKYEEILKYSYVEKLKDHLFLYEKKDLKLVLEDENSFTYYKLFNNIIMTATDNGIISRYNIEGNLIDSYVNDKQNIENLVNNKEYIISINNNNIINIWKIEEDSEEMVYPIVKLFIDKNNEYVIWTDEGYFTVSSPSALKYVTWHMNQGQKKEAKRYDIGKFYDVFFRPDLVKLKLQGENISEFTKGLTAKDALKNPPPEIKITYVDEIQVLHKNDLTYVAELNTSKNMAKIKFKVSDIGGGVGRVRIYQEGKLIKNIGSKKINRTIANVDAKLQEFQNEKEYEKLQYAALSKAVNGNKLSLIENVFKPKKREKIINSDGVYEIEVSLRAGVNQISVEAFNKTNTITSFRASININADIQKREAKLYAIIIGVNEFESSYGDSLQNLRYSLNDAEAMKELVFNSKGKVFDKVEITHLQNTQVTKENIFKAFSEIQEKATLEDTVLFYISTHGVSANGKFYLIPANNKKMSSLIEFRKIFEKSTDIRSLKQIFIIDTCQSGNANDVASAIYDSRASVLARSSGIHLLSASTSGTNAFENDKVRHSNFTYQIMQALQNVKTDKNKDGYASIIEISNSVKKQNSQNVKQFPVIQNIGRDVKLKRF